MAETGPPVRPPVKQKIETLYRLSELQETMLVHRLRAGGAHDAGLLVVRGRLCGELSLKPLETAWRETVAHHPVLRSSVHWAKLKHPLQLIERAVELPIEYYDWRTQSADGSTPAANLELRLAEWIDDSRRRGLEISRAPVMRLALLRVADDEHRFVWTCHHLLLDGWSSALVLTEWLERYEAEISSREYRPPVGPSFQQYVAWLRRSEALDPAEFWRPRSQRNADSDRRNRTTAVELLSAPRLELAPVSDGVGAPELLERRTRLATADVEAWARRHRVTASSIFAGCWGWTLAVATGGDRPVFGLTVSGRGVPFDGIESIVGMLAGVLPVQLPLDREQAPPTAFREVLRRQQELQPFAHCSLPRLFEAGGVSLRRAPFDSLLVHANFPGSRELGSRELDSRELGAESGGSTKLSLRDLHGDLTSGYPLTVAILPSEEVRVEVRFDAAQLSPTVVGEMVDRFIALINCVVADIESTARIGDLLRLAPGDPNERDPNERDLHRKPGGGTNSQSDVAIARRPPGGTGVEPPATPAEAQLMRIWNDLIDVQEYGVDDNFFDLGGHSLLVPQLIARVEQDFGVSLPLGAVLGAPTVRQMAAVLADSMTRGASRSSWQSLVDIRPTGDATPLHMVHGLGGEVGWFYQLANYLDPEVPLYGLQAPSEPFDDLPAMASHYLSELRAVQPSGPYRVGGYCVGGGVAYEMASQLLAAGETVEALVLIDSVPQAHAFGEAGSASVRIARRAKHLLSKPPREIVSSVVDAARTTARKMASRNAPGARTDANRLPELPDVLDMRTLPEVYHRAAARHFRAMRDYTPGPYSGDAWLFRTDDARFGEDFGWGSLVQGRLGVERVPGRHIDVLKEPHVQEVGRKLSAALQSTAG